MLNISVWEYGDCRMNKIHIEKIEPEPIHPHPNSAELRMWTSRHGVQSNKKPTEIKMKKGNCEKCYVLIKRYTPIKGFFLSLFAIIILMIPIFNLYICKMMYDDGLKKPIPFWQECWYNIEKQYIKR